MKNFRKGRKRLMDWLSLYISILFLSSSQLLFCTSDDRLTLGDSISVNQTLVSDGGAFALGFFSPSNSSNNLYIGIWYATIPLKTVIWIMNREKPLMDSFGVLKISNYSNLLIFDSKENVHWSSNVSTSSLPRNGTAAVLLNTGNFVLRQGDGTILWQSFDHPTDTFIPGMKLEYNYKTHFTQGITSWKNLLDPSPGNFSLGVDPSTSLQLFLWQGLKPYWRSSVWSGNFFSRAQLTNGDYAAYLTTFATNEDIYMTFGLTDSSAIIRYMLDSTGQIKLLSWNQSSNKWSNLWSRPLIGCDAYGLCGSFGYCDTTESVPTCKCLEGFEPKVQRDWTNGNFSGGCIREKTLDCGNGDGFLILRGMKVPDRFVFLHNQSMSECEAACLGNCSCTAYAYANLSNGTANVSRCLVWFDELIDVEQVGSSGEDLYLRLAASELGGRRKTNILVILLPIAGVILLIACIFTVWKCRDKMKGSGKKKNKLSILNDVSSSIEFPKEFSGSSGFGEGNSGEGTELPLFTIDSIAIATNNFSDACKLGQGGFGKVYKGTLPGGQEIAVKRLSRGSGQGLQEFKNEIRLIAKLQHRNLVRLLGCCIQEEEKILLYEYMANKSLDAFLFDPTKKALLDWGKRFDIIKGIARGLLYLHQDSRLRIIHRDLKVSNILLDIEMNPKISDFGMARIFGGNQNEANTLRVVGTYGYMSPEYAMEGLFSVKSDVYSFGVLLLEIVCGLKNSSFHLTMDYPNLLSYAWKFWNEGKAMDIVDQSISGSCSSHEVRRCIHVGLLCVQHQPNDRPPMSSVVFMLENENATFLTPKQPIYTAGRNLDRNDPPMYISDAMSVNNVTITQVEGR